VANAAFSFTRRKFSAESSTTTTAASKPATAAPSTGAAPAAEGAVSSQSSTSGASKGITLVVDTGTAVSLGLAGVATMGASIYAGIQAHQNEKNNTEMKVDLDKAKTAQEAAIEKAIAEKEKVLKAQADSVKAQAWAAYLLPTLTSLGAFGLSAFAVYSGKKP
jgi:hypothetical protein